ILGMMRHWFHIEKQEYCSAINHEFVEKHVKGFDSMKEHVSMYNWEQLEKSSGLQIERIIELEYLLAETKSAVFVWSTGLTMHRCATDNISQVANLALLRGFLGRKHCGLMPIRGHSGVQGSGEMGADPFSLPGGPMDEENRQRVEEV